MGAGEKEMGKKGERDSEVQIASYKNSQGDAKCSIGNPVNSTVITVCGVGWALDLLEDHFVRHINVWSLYCAPETNIIL